jgi:SAM-dependent methyltransferase
MKLSLYILLMCSAFVSCKDIPDDKKKNENNNTFVTDNTNQPDEFKNLVNDFENKSRVIWQKPEMVINLLGDVSNQTVADIGAGTGYFSFKIVPKAKKVIALDIDPRFISFMDSVKKELPLEYQSKFESRLVETNDPKLKTNEVNSVIVVNTYMYIQNRMKYLSILRKGLADNAKILIIDYKDNNLPIGPPSDIKVSLKTVENELKEAGFKSITADDNSLDYQYIVTAVK